MYGLKTCREMGSAMTRDGILALIITDRIITSKQDYKRWGPKLHMKFGYALRVKDVYMLWRKGLVVQGEKDCGLKLEKTLYLLTIAQ